MAQTVPSAPGAPSSMPTPATVECCPQLEPCEVCDVLNFPYRLPFRPLVAAGDQRQVVPVEVTLHYRLTRCSGPLSLGDLLYTTTLLPGERVQLLSSDRHTRFSFDSETNLSYHNETTSEESYYAAGMAYGMSNLNLLDLRLLQILINTAGDLAALRHNRIPALGDGMGKLVAHQAR